MSPTGKIAKKAQSVYMAHCWFLGGIPNPPIDFPTLLWKNAVSGYSGEPRLVVGLIKCVCACASLRVCVYVCMCVCVCVCYRAYIRALWGGGYVGGTHPFSFPQPPDAPLWHAVILPLFHSHTLFLFTLPLDPLFHLFTLLLTF